MASSDTGQKGYKCVLNVSGEEMTIARNVDPALVGDPMDRTTRAGDGWKGTLQGLKGWEVPIEHLSVPDNTQFEVFRAAWVAGTNVAVQFLDGDGYGWSGNAVPTELSHGEPIDGVVMGSVKLVGDGALTWIDPSS